MFFDFDSKLHRRVSFIVSVCFFAASGYVIDVCFLVLFRLFFGSCFTHALLKLYSCFTFCKG